MESGRWCTAADVAADLARASGRRGPALDAACLLRGVRPPPPLRSHSEERQGPAAAAAAGWPAPDLRAITHMIRMVHNSEDVDDPMKAMLKQDSTDSPSSSSDVFAISKLHSGPSRRAALLTDGSGRPTSVGERADRYPSGSKLNPNVAEFVPKSKVSLSSSRTESVQVSVKDPVEGPNGMSGRNGDRSDEPQKERSSPSAKQIEMRNRYEKEREELATMLRRNISGNGDDGGGRQSSRRQHTAIARLLRLHAAPTLRTPAYYQQNAPLDDTPTAPEETEPTPEEPEPAPEREQQAAARDKVEAWLSGEAHPAAAAPPPRACSPPLHLGPVTFRRRERRPPAPAPTSPPSPPAPRPAPAAYVPASRAEAARREYEERAAAAQAPAPRTLWERLEHELRRKDEEIRARSDATRLTPDSSRRTPVAPEN